MEEKRLMIGPLNCKEVTTRLALKDLQQYSLADRVMIRFHLMICWVCRKYEKQMKVIGLAFKSAYEKRQTTDVPAFKARLQTHLQK